MKSAEEMYRPPEFLNSEAEMAIGPGEKVYWVSMEEGFILAVAGGVKEKRLLTMVKCQRVGGRLLWGRRSGWIFKSF